MENDADGSTRSPGAGWRRSKRKVEARIPRLELTEDEIRSLQERRDSMRARIASAATRVVRERESYPSVEEIVDIDPSLSPATVRRYTRPELGDHDPSAAAKLEYIKGFGHNRWSRAWVKARKRGERGETPTAATLGQPRDDDGQRVSNVTSGPARTAFDPDARILIIRLRRELDTARESNRVLKKELAIAREEIRRLERALDED